MQHAAAKAGLSGQSVMGWLGLYQHLQQQAQQHLQQVSGLVRASPLRHG